jgi:hypothetical protein
MYNNFKKNEEQNSISLIPKTKKLNSLVTRPSRALALSCKKGRTEIPKKRTALFLLKTMSFGSS